MLKTILLSLFSPLNLVFLFLVLSISPRSTIFNVIIMLLIAINFYCEVNKKQYAISKVLKQNRDFIRPIKSYLKEHLNVDWYTGKKNLFTLSELKFCNLFSFDRVDFDDSFKGVFNGIEYKLCEISLYRKINLNRAFKEYCEYRGILFSCPINKQNINMIKIFPNMYFYKKYISIALIFLPIISGCVVCFLTFMYNKECFNLLIYIIVVICVIGVLLKLYFLNKKEDVVLESSEWLKQYRVEADDQIESRYILTPSFIERFMKLKTIMKSNDIRCSITDGQIYIAVKTMNDMFEIASVLSPIENSHYLENFIEKIKIFQSLVEHFKLDQNIDEK